MNFILKLAGYFFKILIKRSLTQQKSSALQNPELWNCDINEKGNLSISHHDVLDLVKQYGSPLLVVNREKLLQDIKEMLVAISRLPEGSKILYSYKTNCIPGILKLIHETGIGAEVISPYELWLSHKLGVSGDDIIYNGVDKSEDSVRLAIEMGVLSINVDYIDEIEKIARIARELNKTARVGIRLAFSNRSQFGLSIDTGEAIKACELIQQYPDCLSLHCIHFSIASNVKNSKTHTSHAIKALNFIDKLKREYNIVIEYLDIGGGYGVPTSKNMSGAEYGLYRAFGVLPKAPNIKDFQIFSDFVTEFCHYFTKECVTLGMVPPKLLFEPGRAITSQSEVLLGTVLAIKEKNDGTKFAITNVGRLSMTFPCDFEYHQILLANNPGKELTENYQIMGRICTSADWVAKNRLMPEISVGDVIAVMDAGAYFSSYSSTFAFPRPAIALVDKAESKLMRKAESFEYLVQNDTSI